VDDLLSVEFTDDQCDDFQVKVGFSVGLANASAADVHNYLDGVREGLRIANFYRNG
jgi:hypothetical protein